MKAKTLDHHFCILFSNFSAAFDTDHLLFTLKLTFQWIPFRLLVFYLLVTSYSALSLSIISSSSSSCCIRHLKIKSWLFSLSFAVMTSATILNETNHRSTNIQFCLPASSCCHSHCHFSFPKLLLVCTLT
jgi:hypothetical protein